ncbi:MAG: hypothetical protein JXR48_12665 [Candidatus Delongbacteria bacterium]|nr:hypothetical protein [Candidatus Delongbacteria bacterium]MBN2835804.1 hypothetical protein [Candidatus Delongbacteria bacterium]
MKKTIILLLTFILTLFGSGKYAGEFITGSIDARSLALGNNILTSFSTASSAYFNPAFLPEMTKSSITLNHSERFDGWVNQEYAAYTSKMNDLSFGLYVIRLGVDDVPVTAINDDENDPSLDNRPYIVKEVSDNEIAVGLSLGKRYNEVLNYGVSAKILYKGFEEESAFGLGFDLSMLYKMNDDLNFAAKLQDVTTSGLFWTTGENEFIKPSLYGGAEYNFFWEYLDSSIKLISGMRVGSEGYNENAAISFSEFDVTFNGGAELLLNEFITLRGGSEMERWSVGAGINLYGVSLDYAFKPDDELGDTHKASISYGWGD